MGPLVIRLVNGRVAGHVGMLLVAVALVLLLLLLLCLLVTVAAEHLVEEGAELSGYRGGEGEEGEEDEVEGAHFDGSYSWRMLVDRRWRYWKRTGGVVVVLAAWVAMRWDDDVGKLSITRLAGWLAGWAMAMAMPLVMKTVLWSLEATGRVHCKGLVGQFVQIVTATGSMRDGGTQLLSVLSCLVATSTLCG